MTLHAIRRERQSLRIVQAKSVMPLVGGLLDAWEGMANDVRTGLRETDPLLCRYLDQIDAAMETGIPLIDN